MNGFSAGKDVKPPPELTLLTSTFQNLFPAVSAHTTPVSSIRRVLLCNRTPFLTPDGDEDGHVIDVRHYSISTKPVGQPRAVRKTSAKAAASLPNLAKFEDVADFVLSGNGYDSASEVEEDEKVEIGKQGGPQQRGIRLTEIGPRLRLELVKVEEGMCDGKVMFHRYVHKTKVISLAPTVFWGLMILQREEKELENRHKQRVEEKAKRRKEQEENVARKLAEKEARGQKEKVPEENEEMDLEGDDEEVQDEDEMLLELENELHGN
jgi:ribosome biogenesis protein SSF1/2